MGRHCACCHQSCVRLSSSLPPPLQAGEHLDELSLDMGFTEEGRPLATSIDDLKVLVSYYSPYLWGIGEVFSRMPFVSQEHTRQDVIDLVMHGAHHSREAEGSFSLFH